MADLAPGTLVAGRYRLEYLLGEGGMGAVWAATHEITGGRVALKFLKAAGDPRSDARRRFLREARAATLVDHPNVVQIRDVVDHEDTPVLVMDLLNGETLATRLSRFGSFDLGEAARIGLQIVSAVGAAHEAGLIHRDLKPENVFLSRVTGSGEIVRVLDFGIAKLVGQGNELSTAVTQSGALIGTPAYMAPEQVFGERELDHRVDIWAIGVLLHEMLTGSRPVEGENYGQIAKKLLSGPITSIAVRRPDLPDDVIDLVDRMLARDRANRLDDLREAVDVLALHANAKRPSFGPPRAPRITQDSGPGLDSEPRRVDPGAPTEDVSSKQRASIPQELLAAQQRAPNDTLVAGSTPRPRQDTAAAHVTATHASVRSPRSTLLVVSLAGLLVLAAIGVGVRSFKAAPPALAPSTSTTALAAPTLNPLPAEPIVGASAVPSSASSSPTATAAPTTTARTSVTAEPTAVPPKATAKPAKSAVSAAIAPSVPVTAPTATAPAPATTTTGGGLVTKPPF